MKKLMILLLLFVATTFVGCDFFSNGVTSTASLTENTEISTIDNENINVTPNVNDVAYESLFDDANYKKLTLYFTMDDLVYLIETMEAYHDNYGHYRNNTTIPADVVYEDGNGNVMIMNEVGYRTKGNTYTRVPPGVLDGDEIIQYLQGSFQLEFNNTFDYTEGSTMYTYYQTREFFDLEQLNFKTIKSGDFAVVTESVAYDMFREIGVNTSNTSYAVIYFNVDGVVIPYGLFLVQEVIDDVFAEMTYGENPDGSIGEVYKCTWQLWGPATLSAYMDDRALGISDWTIGWRRTYALKTNKEAEDYTSFWDFIQIANSYWSETYYDDLAASLDMDSFAKALAMHFLVGSPDDYRSNANNYYMYFNQGSAYYIPFDFDNSMGYGWNPYEDYGISLDIDTVEIVSTYYSPEHVVLAYYLLQNDTFRDMYLHYLDLYTSEGTVFSEAYCKAEFDLIESLYSEEIMNGGHLGINWFSFYERYDAMTLSDYITQKTEAVRTQLEALGY